VPDKNAVFKDIFRVLKPGGHFCISDVVLSGKLPDALKKDAEMYAGCVSGAIQKEVYLELIVANGFKDIHISIEKSIYIPDDILSRYMNQDEIHAYRSGSTGIFSITVSAYKPNSQNECKPGAGCC
jgi:SAM-dependent methyltransferase